MIRATKVTIPFVSWRGGRPRFTPGPNLRALGMQPRDLKDAAGAWLSFEATVAESKKLELEIAAAKAGQVKPLRAVHAGKTLGQVCEAVFQLDEFKGKAVVDGRRVRKGLAAKTVSSYFKSRRAVEQACQRLLAKAAVKGAPYLWDLPAPAFSVKLGQELINEVERHSGLHQARAVRAFLSQAWNRVAIKEQGVVRDLWGQLEALPMPDGRVSPWEPHEFWHMVRTADAMGRPEVADLWFIGALHGYRQIDRLQIRGAVVQGEHIVFKPSKSENKTGVSVRLKMDYWLQLRMQAARKRREASTIVWQELFIDETEHAPWNIEGSYYRHVVAAIRARAAMTMPSCARLRDQDLRDTNQTWLDRCSIDPKTMALMVGHSLGEKHSEIQRRHYVAANQVRMDAAVDAISAYLSTHAGASDGLPNPIPMQQHTPPG